MHLQRLKIKDFRNLKDFEIVRGIDALTEKMKAKKIALEDLGEARSSSPANRQCRKTLGLPTK